MFCKRLAMQRTFKIERMGRGEGERGKEVGGGEGRREVEEEREI